MPGLLPLKSVEGMGINVKRSILIWRKKMLIDGLRVWSRKQTERRMKMEGCPWVIKKMGLQSLPPDGETHGSLRCH